MARPNVFISVLVLMIGFPGALAWSQSPPAVDAPLMKVTRPPQLPDTPPGRFQSEWGFVTVVSEKGITIKKPGWSGPRYVMSPGGEVRLIESFYNPPEPARSFVFSTTLLSGKYLTNQGPYSYSIKDINEGDKVYVKFSRKAGRETCEAIMIMARPGGLIPPIPEEAEADPRIRYHEYANANIALREKGIPLPNHMLPPWERGPTPVAPAPREINPPMIPQAQP